jgi:hypothetical protein
MKLKRKKKIEPGNLEDALVGLRTLKSAFKITVQNHKELKLSEDDVNLLEVCGWQYDALCSCWYRYVFKNEE